MRDDGANPPGADCALLETERTEPGRVGTGEDLTPGGPLERLLCPQCLTDPRLQPDIPMQRIDRRLVPPPDESWGLFECARDCARWLLRVGDAALMLVHVGASPLCGATGNCPGRLYERAAGRWQLLESYTSGEALELCVSTARPGVQRLWITPLGTGGSEALRLNWRPEPAR